MMLVPIKMKKVKKVLQQIQDFEGFEKIYAFSRDGDIKRITAWRNRIRLCLSRAYAGRQ